MQSLNISTRIAAFVVSAAILSSLSSCKEEPTNPNNTPPDRIAKITWLEPYDSHLEYIAFNWSNNRIASIVYKTPNPYFEPREATLSYNNNGLLNSATITSTSYSFQQHDSGFNVVWKFGNMSNTYTFLVNSSNQIFKIFLNSGKYAVMEYAGGNVQRLMWYSEGHLEYEYSYNYIDDPNFMQGVSPEVEALFILISDYAWGLPFHFLHSKQLVSSYDATYYDPQKTRYRDIEYQYGASNLPMQVDLIDGQTKTPYLKLEY